MQKESQVSFLWAQSYLWMWMKSWKAQGGKRRQIIPRVPCAVGFICTILWNVAAVRSKVSDRMHQGPDQSDGLGPSVRVLRF